MNTKEDFGGRPEVVACGREIAWVTEREHDLATWLDEVDLDLHEQMVCGSTHDVEERIAE